MVNFEKKGILEVILEEQVFASGFKKLEFVLSVPNADKPEWIESIKFQLLKEDTALIAPFGVGEEVTVGFNLVGKAYERDGKTTYFTNLDAKKITLADGTIPTATATEPEAAAEENKDLPF